MWLLSAIGYLAIKYAEYKAEQAFVDYRVDKSRKKSDDSTTWKLNNLPSAVVLNKHELIMAKAIIDPQKIDTSWNDIAGLDHLVEELKANVILPVTYESRGSRSNLLQPPKGVLLYGPPGCGKTMLAKAVAKECGAYFVNVDVSQMTSMWYGESTKFAKAIFTLAQKLQPCIIFVDEIDSLLRTRNSFDNEATALIKAQFMQMWDGLETCPTNKVVVMGATNRPQDIDRAIWRRLPARFHLQLPNGNQRECIFRKMLSVEDVDDGVDFENLARKSEGFSGSDIREVCRKASVSRLKLRQTKLRRVSNKDLVEAIDTMVF